MKFFWQKEKTPTITNEQETARLLHENDSKQESLSTILGELTERAKLGITKTDYLQVMVEALIKIHPGVKDDSNVIDFMKRLADYEAKHK